MSNIKVSGARYINLENARIDVNAITSVGGARTLLAEVRVSLKALIDVETAIRRKIREYEQREHEKTQVRMFG